MNRAAIVTALDALEAGDTRLCEAILIDALEGWSPASTFASTNTTRTGCACRLCGRTFRWPGLRDQHQQLTHGNEEVPPR